jgi:hypothetical protein
MSCVLPSFAKATVGKLVVGLVRFGLPSSNFGLPCLYSSIFPKTCSCSPASKEEESLDSTVPEFVEGATSSFTIPELTEEPSSVLCLRNILTFAHQLLK